MDDVFARIEAVRAHRRDLVERLEVGALSLPELFAASTDDDVLAGTKILPLVEAIPGVGKVQTRRALEAAGIDEAAHVDEIPTDARDTLLSALGVAVS